MFDPARESTVLLCLLVDVFAIVSVLASWLAGVSDCISVMVNAYDRISFCTHARWSRGSQYIHSHGSVPDSWFSFVVYASLRSWLPDTCLICRVWLHWRGGSALGGLPLVVSLVVYPQWSAPVGLPSVVCPQWSALSGLGYSVAGWSPVSDAVWLEINTDNHGRLLSCLSLGDAWCLHGNTSCLMGWWTSWDGGPRTLFETPSCSCLCELVF